MDDLPWAGRLFYIALFRSELNSLLVQISICCVVVGQRCYASTGQWAWAFTWSQGTV